MKYGYRRVSTKKQGKDGNSLEAQERLLIENGVLTENIFTDEYTGTKKNRPALDKLLKVLKNGDMLVVTKLDRMARSTIQGLQLVEELLSRGVVVNVLNMGVMDDSPNGKLTRTMFFAFAEFERNMIVERTQEGKEIARETNPDYKDGRKKIEIPDFPIYEQRVQNGELTVIQAARELGISRRTWYNFAKDRMVQYA